MSKKKKIILRTVLLIIFIEITLNIFCFFYTNVYPAKKSMRLSHFIYVPYIDHYASYTTDNNTKTNNKNIDEIWMFGGSSLFGVGASSREYTISEQLSRIVNSKDLKYKVINYGQPGFVINQERIFYFELLRHKKPKMVIFFNGINEIAPGKIGAPVVAEDLTNIINNDIGYMKFGLIRRKIKFIYLIDCLLQLPFTENKHNIDNNPLMLQDNRLDTASIDAVIENYIYNMKLINIISNENNIKVYYFWQPVYFLKKLTPKENDNLKKVNIDYYLAAWKSLYKKVEQNNYLKPFNNFYYLGNFFNNNLFNSKDIFDDFCHLNDYGYGEIAKVIYNTINKHGI